jgi:membrane dipeptidase
MRRMETGLLRHAREVHRAHPVVEAHGDVPIDLWRRRRTGEAAPLRDDYLGRLREGGVRFEFMTVGGDMPVTMDGEGRPDLRAREMIDDVVSEVEDSDELRVVRRADDLDAVLASDEVGLVLHFEGCRPLLGRPELARAFHELGLRSAQLTWNYRNEVADGIGAPAPGGLTAAGREAVAELDRLGFLFDVSHLAEQGFWELVELARSPVVASHANASAVWSHPRNLTDEQARAIAATGGYVGVCFFPAFIGPEPSLERLLDHVDHLAEVVGVDHIAVGPDYVEFVLDLMTADMTYGDASVDYGASWTFPEGLQRVETLPVFTAGLLARGYGEEQVAKILGGNVLRVLRAILPQR